MNEKKLFLSLIFQVDCCQCYQEESVPFWKIRLYHGKNSEINPILDDGFFSHHHELRAPGKQ
jgi:hypothetical protein